METKDIFGNVPADKKAEKKAEKKTAKTVKKATAPKSCKEIKKTVFIEYLDKQVDEDAIVKKIKDELKAQKVTVKELKLYVKPEDNACYYVANGEVEGRVDLF